MRRYALHPPVAGARLHLTAAGQVVLQLRHEWADGTTHVAFTPTAFLERLAVLVPRRAFEVDVLKCPRCGGRLRLIALIEASAVARRIVTHLALPPTCRDRRWRAPTSSSSARPQGRGPAGGAIV